MDDPGFVDLCERELRLCAVHEGEALVVVSQGHERADYADAFLAAGARLGALGLHLRLPESSPGLDGQVGVWTAGATPLARHRPAVETLLRADIVVDVMFLLHSKELVEVQESGTRILTCIEPVDVLARLFPNAVVTARVDHALALLRRASTLRITNPAGTDVTYRLGSYASFGQYGYANQPGQWDHWSSSGMAYTYASDDGVDGVVVVAPGDIILPFKRYVSTPIEFTIAAGRIQEIRGGVDAALVRDYIASFDDPDAYGLSHIGWGMNENAKWTALATDRRGHGMESRGFWGCVLFSTGPNTQAGGPNNTSCHLDIPMRGATLFLDEKPVVKDGEVVEELHAAPSAESL